MSQTLIVVSLEPERMRFPSGEKMTAVISRVCPVNGPVTIVVEYMRIINHDRLSFSFPFLISATFLSSTSVLFYFDRGELSYPETFLLFIHSLL